MKRNFKVVITSPCGKVVANEMVAEEMKSLDCAIILLDWNDDSCSYVEVGFFRFDTTDTVEVTSVPIA